MKLSHFILSASLLSGIFISSMTVSAPTHASTWQRIEFTVDGMNCTRCEHRIEGMLKRKVSGISNVSASHVHRRVNFLYDGSSETLQRVRDVIRDLGYTVE